MSLEIRKEAWEAEGGIHDIKLSEFPAEVRGSLVSAKRLRARAGWALRA
jgi:hypothetical protein